MNLRRGPFPYGRLERVEIICMHNSRWASCDFYTVESAVSKLSQVQ